MTRSLVLAILLFPAIASGQTDHRFEGGLFFTGTFLKEIGTRDAGVGTSAGGLGGRLVYRLAPHVDLESDIIFLPGNRATSGNRIQIFLGGKAGWRFEKIGLFARAAPGFIHFRKDPFGVSRPGSGVFPDLGNWASSTEPLVGIGGVFEYYTSRGPIVRFDLTDTIIHYAPRTVVVSQFVPPIQAGGFTTHNTQWSVGINWAF